MNEVRIKEEYIRLGQALKLCGAADSGVDAKVTIQEGQVKVNGETCFMRGKKMRKGDTFEVEGISYIIVS